MTDDIRILKEEQIQKKKSQGEVGVRSQHMIKEGLRLREYYQHPSASRRQRK